MQTFPWKFSGMSRKDPGEWNYGWSSGLKTCTTLIVFSKEFAVLSIFANSKYFWWRTIIHVDAFCVIIIYPIYSNRSSCPGVFCKKGILKNFTKFTGKHLCQSLFLIKLQALGPDIRRPWQRCFPVNFAKFLRTPFLTKHLPWLLLSKMWLALQFSIFRMSSFIEDFLVISFQQKN